MYSGRGGETIPAGEEWVQRACGWRELSIFEKLKEGSRGRSAEQAVSRLLTLLYQVPWVGQRPQVCSPSERGSGW